MDIGKAARPRVPAAVLAGLATLAPVLPLAGCGTSPPGPAVVSRSVPAQRG